MGQAENNGRSTNARTKYQRIIFYSLLVASFFIGSWFFENYPNLKNDSSASVGVAGKVELGAFPITIPTTRWGFVLDTFQMTEETIRQNQVFSDVLSGHGIDFPTIQKIVDASKSVFEVKNWRVGKNYTVLNSTSTEGPDYLVYEPNVYEYFVFDLQKGTCSLEKRPVITETKAAAGKIESSLWKAIIDAGMSYEIADKMEDALQWSVDFHHTQPGDEFKLFFEEKLIEGDPVGVGNLYAAWYKTGKNEYHAIWFDDEKHKGYYDLEGRPMNKGFLKAPVKYARISSGYNLRRFHPILKRVRPHFGTDYAAPAGTPILAVGDGVVVEAAYGKGNGNYVKIKHDGTYTTQYLHMKGFAKGIRRGVHVQQGQTIGYVGSTGLATGPHVCFRFWKNGQQVNHLKLTMPPPKPLDPEVMPEFILKRDEYVKALSLARLETLRQGEIETSIQQP